jgi:hypothetical protein
MESVRVNYIFWLRTESHGCIHYNGNGALNVMQTKKRLTTAERLSTFQKGHCFQMLRGNGSTVPVKMGILSESAYICQMFNRLPAPLHTVTQAVVRICLKTRVQQRHVSHSVQRNTVRVTRSEACRSVRLQQQRKRKHFISRVKNSVTASITFIVVRKGLWSMKFRRQRKQQCKISGTHSGVFNDSNPLGRYSVSTDEKR